jgi:hypothetical protein
LGLKYVFVKTRNSFLNQLIIETEAAIEHLDIPVQNACRILAHIGIKQYERWCTECRFDGRQINNTVKFMKHLICTFEKQDMGSGNCTDIRPRFLKVVRENNWSSQPTPRSQLRRPCSTVKSLARSSYTAGHSRLGYLVRSPIQRFTPPKHLKVDR